MESGTNQRSSELRGQRKDRVKVRGKHTETLCDHCGQALSDFLRQMKEHNAVLVSPLPARSIKRRQRVGVNAST